MTFADYIRHAKPSNTAKGDFIADAKHDLKGLAKITSWHQLQTYLYLEHNACPEAINAARKVWTDFQSSGFS